MKYMKANMILNTSKLRHNARWLFRMHSFIPWADASLMRVARLKVINLVICKRDLKANNSHILNMCITILLHELKKLKQSGKVARPAGLKHRLLFFSVSDINTFMKYHNYYVVSQSDALVNYSTKLIECIKHR